jgi:hypothetical protein
VSATLIKNLGPVLAGMMLCGRVGSGIDAELGSMVVTNQISAGARRRSHQETGVPRACSLAS